MSPIKMEKAEKANRLGLKYIEAINAQRIEMIEKSLHSECIWETSASSPEDGKIIGGKNIVEYWKNKFGGRLKHSIKVEEIMGSGLRCILFEEIEEEKTGGLHTIRRAVEIFEVQGEEIIRIRSYTKT